MRPPGYLPLRRHSTAPGAASERALARFAPAPMTRVHAVAASLGVGAATPSSSDEPSERPRATIPATNASRRPRRIRALRPIIAVKLSRGRGLRLRPRRYQLTPLGLR